MSDESEIIKVFGEKIEEFGSKKPGIFTALQMMEEVSDKVPDKNSYSAENDIKRIKKDFELGTAEEKYRAIFENYAIAITLADEKEHIVLWNKYAEELLNMNEEDLFMKPVESLYPPEEWKRIRSENVRQKGIKYRMETRMLRKDKGPFDVEISLCTLKGAGGNVIGSIGIIKDITELKKIKKELTEYENVYRTVFENSAVAITVTDENEKIVSWNKYAENILMMDKNDLYMRPINSLYPSDEWRRIRSENVRQKGMQHHMETKIINKNNELIDVDLSLSVLKNSEGKVIGSIGVIKDITEKKKVERAAKYEHDLMQSLLDNISDSIFIKDDKNRFIKVNKAKAMHLNVAPEEMIGKTDFDFYSKEEAEKMIFDEKYVMVHKDIIHREEKITRPNGEQVWVSVAKAPYYDNHGNVVGILGISRDITDRKKYEEALYESEERFRDLFENANDLIQSVDIDGRFIYVNKKWLRTLGYTEDEAKNLTITEILRKDQIPHCMEIIKEIYSGKSFDKVETVFVSKDGREIYVEGNANARFKDGKFIATRSIFRDVTEKKKAEEELKESEERHRILFESSRDAIMTLEPPSWGFTSGNPATVEMFKANNEEEFISHGPWELSPEHQPDGRPSKEKAKEMIETAMREGSNFFEWTHRSLDGTNFPATVLLTRMEIKGKQFLQATVRDITDRKKYEEALYDSRERYRTIFENSAVAIMATDDKENIISWNAYTEKMLGMDKNDLYMKSVKSLYPEDEWKKIREENLRQKGMQHHFETRMLKKNNEPIDIDISLSIIKDKDGTITGSIGVIRDITKRKIAENELNKEHQQLISINQNLEEIVGQRTAEVKNLLKQKDEFIYQLSHDLKTPLTPLNSLLPVVRKKVEDEELKKYLDLAIQNVGYMKNLVQKTITLAILNSTSVEFEIENVKIWDIIERVTKKHDNISGKNNIKIENLIVKDVMIKADKLRFEELMDNLISNAIKYTPEGGKIEINSERQGDLMRFSVRDTGVGMTKEQSEKVFNEFYKADKSRHDFQSSGLGPSICKRIVDKHGGKIWVESEGLGKGSTFYFTFKIAENEEGIKVGGDNS